LSSFDIRQYCGHFLKWWILQSYLSFWRSKEKDLNLVIKKSGIFFAEFLSHFWVSFFYLKFVISNPTTNFSLPRFEILLWIFNIFERASFRKKTKNMFFSKFEKTKDLLNLQVNKEFKKIPFIPKEKFFFKEFFRKFEEEKEWIFEQISQKLGKSLIREQ